MRNKFGAGVLAIGFTLVLAACGGSGGGNAGGEKAAGNAGARDQLRIVGSSTVFPFSTAVAEQFASRGQFKTPVVESTGTGGGLKLFCAGVGAAHPDIANASRRIKASEFADCAAAGVTGVVEVPIGFDGIVLATKTGQPPMNITKRQIFLALAKEIPDGDGFIPNPYVKWSDIDPKLPNEKIEVMGPPPTSGTRDSWNELALAAGARQIESLNKLYETDEAEFNRRANVMREDGAWKDGGENDNIIVQTLSRNPTMYGVFGFSFYEENLDRVQAAKIAGVEPTFESISSGDYLISRDMYIYLKKQHVGVIPGLQEFAAEFVSDKAAGPKGYLKARGIVPLTAEKLTIAQADVAGLKVMTEAPK